MAATLEELAQLYQAQQTKITYLHQQLEEMKTDKKKLQDTAKNDNKKSMTPMNALNPGKYEGPRGEIKFRPWVADMKVIAMKYSKKLHDSMSEVQYRKETITKEQVTAA